MIAKCLTLFLLLTVNAYAYEGTSESYEGDQYEQPEPYYEGDQGYYDEAPMAEPMPHVQTKDQYEEYDAYDSTYEAFDPYEAPPAEEYENYGEPVEEY